MEELKIIYTSAASVIVLFVLTKIIGNKQMSQLNMFDYILGITIGSIAAEMATALEDDMAKPLIAMLIYAIMSLIISFAVKKSMFFRRLLSGKSVVLFCDGTIYRKNLKSVHFNVDDLLTQCRINGYFSLSEVDTVYIEEDGKMSVLPKSCARPLTPSDMSMNPPQEKPDVCVIIDGKILNGNLKSRNKSLSWLNDRIHEQGYKTANEIILATLDKDNNVSIYNVNNSKVNRDIFQ